jgi:hypothetical protein
VIDHDYECPCPECRQRAAKVLMECVTEPNPTGSLSVGGVLLGVMAPRYRLLRRGDVGSGAQVIPNYTGDLVGLSAGAVHQALNGTAWRCSKSTRR